MNKDIFGDMVTEKLKREIGMVPKPLPEEVKTLETVLPSGSVRFENNLYQADKLKKISISKRSFGESTAGTIVIMVADDDYDIPSTLADIAFNFFDEKVKISALFQSRPLMKDDESTRNYVEPFQKWYEAIGKLPSEPSITPGEPGEVLKVKPAPIKSMRFFPDSYVELGEFLKANPAPIKYMRFIPDSYLDEVLKFAEQFFDIFVDIYHKAEPVRDAQRKRQMQAFRSEFNKHILRDDPSGRVIMEIFGQQKAELFYDYLVYL